MYDEKYVLRATFLFIFRCVRDQRRFCFTYFSGTKTGPKIRFSSMAILFQKTLLIVKDRVNVKIVSCDKRS